MTPKHPRKKPSPGSCKTEKRCCNKNAEKPGVDLTDISVKTAELLKSLLELLGQTEPGKPADDAACAVEALLGNALDAFSVPPEPTLTGMLLAKSKYYFPKGSFQAEVVRGPDARSPEPWLDFTACAMFPGGTRVAEGFKMQLSQDFDSAVADFDHLVDSFRILKVPTKEEVAKARKAAAGEFESFAKAFKTCDKKKIPVTVKNLEKLMKEEAAKRPAGSCKAAKPVVLSKAVSCKDLLGFLLENTKYDIPKTRIACPSKRTDSRHGNFVFTLQFFSKSFKSLKKGEKDPGMKEAKFNVRTKNESKELLVRRFDNLVKGFGFPLKKRG